MAENILLYNTLLGKKEAFVPHDPKSVSVYSCGPTVYGDIHVGNARAVISQDLLVRVLSLAGYEVNSCRNYTDVDDKIIKVANERELDASEITEQYIKAFDLECEKLGLVKPLVTPKVTETMDEIIIIIQELIKSDSAYASQTPFGQDVYFRTRSFESYGKLSKRKIDDLQVGARVEIGEAKDDPLDFALWKAAKPGEPSWSSPWGEGRPGWHIECSAMIRKHFPERKAVDIHAGGIDLIFPHHENEIAQSEACDHHQLARYWFHNGMLVIGKEKMSKSVGNFFTSLQFTNEFGAEVLKLMTYQHHYRSPMDFSEKSIVQAENLLKRIYQARMTAQGCQQEKAKSDLIPESLSSLVDHMKKALFDDCNTAKSLGFFLGAMRLCQKHQLREFWSYWLEAFDFWNNNFALFNKENVLEAVAQIDARKRSRLNLTEERCQHIEASLKKRKELRDQKKFDEADSLRDELEQSGIVIMDSPNGATWTVKKSIDFS